MKGLGFLFLLILGATAISQIPENLFAPPASEKAWAVVVGISRYQVLPKNQWLEFADADAQSFAKYLASGQGLSFPADHIVAVTNEQATRAEVMRVLGAWLLRKAKQGDSIFIFLAAHGIVEPTGPQDAYLVTYDSDPQDLYSTAYSFPQIQDLIQRRLGRAARVLLLTDACRAGKMAESRAFHERVAEMKGPEVFGLLAAAPNEFSLEGKLFGGGHGAFTYFLLRGLQGEADFNGNGRVKFSEALRYVKEQVPKATQGEQNPRELAMPSTDLVLSLTNLEKADLGFAGPPQVQWARLLFDAPGGTELYINGTVQGRVPHTGQLAVDRLKPDNYKIMAVTPRGQRAVQEMLISGDPTEVQFSGTSLLVRGPRSRGWEQESDPDKRRVALEDEGQQVLLAYLKGEAVPLAAEDFERCAAAFAAAADLSADPVPLQARRAFCAGRARLYRGDLEQARTLLEEAIRLDSRAAPAHNALGVVHLQQKNYPEALRRLEEASQRAQRWAYPHFNRALVYTALGQFARAEEAYREAIRLGPSYAYLHYNLGGLYMRINQPTRAEQELRRALELDLDAAAGHTMLGNFFRSRQRDREAETEYRRALQFYPADVPARLNLARLYRDQGRNREAEKELEEALKLLDAPAIRQALEELRKGTRR